MAQREPKSKTTTLISVIGRNSDRKGRFEITSGNINYFRASATDPAGSWTLQQLIEILENDIEFNDASLKRPKFPNKKSKNDLTLCINDTEAHVYEGYIVHESYSLSRFDDERKLCEGSFQIDSPAKKPAFGFTWTITIGINTAIYILDLYISKWLIKKRGDWNVDDDVTVSRGQLKEILRYWLAKLV